MIFVNSMFYESKMGKYWVYLLVVVNMVEVEDNGGVFEELEKEG